MAGGRGAAESLSSEAPTPVELREFQVRTLDTSRLSAADAELLWRRHGQRVEVRFPSPRTEGRWELVAKGWVGFLPVSPTLALRLQPKVGLANLFRMLEVAYRLRSFELLPGLTDCRSLDDLYSRLANVLARRVLARSRRGLYREYVGRHGRPPAVRGRIEVARVVRAPWRVRLACRFQDHTADVVDNRLLLWTLDRIRRCAACRRPEVRHTVRAAYGRLRGEVTLEPYLSSDCVGRTYNRLNDDYRPLHALCRFFLDSSGPSHEAGDRRNLPFVVDMAQLFELFVAEWLRLHLPAPYRVTAQEKVYLDAGCRIRFEIDLVLSEAGEGRTLAVLDTKYKNVASPSTSDVSQVVAYAAAKGCTDAVLVYPLSLERPMELQVGEVRVRTLGFPLDGNLDEAGERVLRALFPGTLESRVVGAPGAPIGPVLRTPAG